MEILSFQCPYEALHCMNLKYDTKKWYNFTSIQYYTAAQTNALRLLPVNITRSVELCFKDKEMYAAERGSIQGENKLAAKEERFCYTSKKNSVFIKKNNRMGFIKRITTGW